MRSGNMTAYDKFGANSNFLNFTLKSALENHSTAAEGARSVQVV